MRDSRGWTALHCAASVDGYLGGLYGLLEDERVDVNAKVKSMSRKSWDRTKATPLHLAVINNNSNAVERLLKNPRTHVNALSLRWICFDDSLYVRRFGLHLFG
jgi:ankyrin repeat protein